MRITRRADYAIRTLLDVASQDGKAVALTHEIAARQGVPAPFLSKIVVALTRAGLLRSYRGARGGVALGRPAADISILHVVEAVDGPLAVNRCVLWPEECERSRDCPIHPVWCQARDLLVKHLGGITLADLADRTRRSEELAVGFAAP